MCTAPGLRLSGSGSPRPRHSPNHAAVLGVPVATHDCRLTPARRAAFSLRAPGARPPGLPSAVWASVAPPRIPPSPCPAASPPGAPAAPRPDAGTEGSGSSRSCSTRTAASARPPPPAARRRAGARLPSRRRGRRRRGGGEGGPARTRRPARPSRTCRCLCTATPPSSAACDAGHEASGKMGGCTYVGGRGGDLGSPFGASGQWLLSPTQTVPSRSGAGMYWKKGGLGEGGFKGGGGLAQTPLLLWLPISACLLLIPGGFVLASGCLQAVPGGVSLVDGDSRRKRTTYANNRVCNEHTGCLSSSGGGPGGRGEGPRGAPPMAASRFNTSLLRRCACSGRLHGFCATRLQPPL